MSQIEIYTDGACLGNPGPGGWAAIINLGDKVKKISGSVPETTNNRMELIAAIKAIEAVGNAKKVTVFTDSKYLQKGITEWIQNWRDKNWKTSNNKPVKNIDLWQELDSLRQNISIKWCWVKAHNNNLMNELTDKLARDAAQRCLR